MKFLFKGFQKSLTMTVTVKSSSSWRVGVLSLKTIGRLYWHNVAVSVSRSADRVRSAYRVRYAFPVFHISFAIKLEEPCTVPWRNPGLTRCLILLKRLVLKPKLMCPWSDARSRTSTEARWNG